MRLFFISLVFCAFTQQASAQAPATPQAPANITVLTDTQLIKPTLPLTRAYTKQVHAPLTTAVMSASVEEQISQGLEAHILLTSDKPLIERLAARGVTDVNATYNYAQSRLALVTTRSSDTNALFSRHISFAALIYASKSLPVFLEPAASDAGTRSNALLNGYEFSSSLKQRVETVESHQQVLAALRENNGLALMLTSDAAAEPDLVVLSILPDSLSTPVPFYAVVLASEQMDEARTFVHFLDSPAAQQLLVKSGFEPTIH